MLSCYCHGHQRSSQDILVVIMTDAKSTFGGHIMFLPELLVVFVQPDFHTNAALLHKVNTLCKMQSVQQILSHSLDVQKLYGFQLPLTPRPL